MSVCMLVCKYVVNFSYIDDKLCNSQTFFEVRETNFSSLSCIDLIKSCIF